jgi:hypothetical protein
MSKLPLNGRLGCLAAEATADTGEDDADLLVS